MIRHTRINAIIELLRQAPQTVERIGEYFNGSVSPRQIRSDIDAIKAMGYGDDEHFETTGAANRKTWAIRPNPYDANTYRLSRAVLPEVFAVKRQVSLDRLTIWPTESATDLFTSTHFYETEAHKKLDDNIERIVGAINSGRKVQISHVLGDATSISEGTDLPLVVLPVQIIYHRGCFYVAAVANNTRQVLTFQIDHLTFDLITDTFDRSSVIGLVEASLNDRFGVTQNIDNQIFDVELRFSSVTGRFVSEQFWHHSQQATPIDDGWQVTFRCGINRELVGWLFQWMSNVRVIGAPELKKLYDEQLARMLNVTSQASDEPLKYTNTFISPKKSQSIV